MTPNPTTTLQKIIPSYTYTQYQDDDDILAFKDAYNIMAQEELDFLNQLNLPVYTQAIISGDLLDWVGQGLYGIPRPIIPLGTLLLIGPLNSFVLNTIPLNALVNINELPFLLAPDDIYKRVLTWHHYRGDGKQFNIPWLKRRITRFFFGANGTDIDNSNFNAVSVTVSGTVFTIACPSASSTLRGIFYALVNARLLELPFQYTYVVTP